MQKHCKICGKNFDPETAVCSMECTIISAY